MITLNRFRRLEAALRRRGYGPTIEWSENIMPPSNADHFAELAVFVIINGGLNAAVAVQIQLRCLNALKASQSAASVFGHPGKAKAVDHVWSERQRLFDSYRTAHDQIDFLQTIPWIGPVLALHLAKLLGSDVAKPDVHLVRLANRDRTTVAKLCQRLAAETGYRVATTDAILWRGSAVGLLKSQVYERYGWSAAISSEVTREAWSPVITEAISVGPVPTELDA